MSSAFDNTAVKLVLLSQSGDSNAFTKLIVEHTFLIRERALSYVYSGIELEDLMQEGMLGFMKAVKSFNPKYNTSFKTFASLCVDRSIISAVNKTFSKHSVPQSVLVSFDDAHETNTVSAVSVENEVFTKLDKDKLFESLELSLSKLELKVFGLFIKGYSYKKISQMLDVSEKTVDNAVQRIRRKLAK